MKVDIVLLALTCVWTVTHAAWFEYRPQKHRVQKLGGHATKKPEVPHYTNSRTSNGPVTVVAVDPKGKFVQLENIASDSNKHDVNLENWRIERTIDGKTKYVYTFHEFTLEAGKTLKIYALSHMGEARIGDVVFLQKSWGVGDYTVTRVFNDKNKEMASYVQKVKRV